MAYMPTPQSILDDTTTDVFAQAIPATVYEYANKRAALWRRYRYVGIGNADTTYWIACVQAREQELASEYDLKIRAFEELKARIAALGVNDIDVSDSSYVESTSVGSQMDPPQNLSSQTVPEKFLTGQDKTVFSQKSYGGVETEELKRWMDSVQDPWVDWVEDFRKLFYWGL